MSFLTQSHQVFFGRPLSNSFNFPRYTTFDPVIIIFMVVIIDDKDVHYIVGTKLTQQCKEIARYLINVRQVEFNLVLHYLLGMQQDCGWIPDITSML